MNSVSIFSVWIGRRFKIPERAEPGAKVVECEVTIGLIVVSLVAFAAG